MFMFRGNTLKELKLESCGHTDKEFFCYYRYKDDCEPEANKIKYPNIKDRWYEDYMMLGIISEAKLSGVDVDISNEDDRIEWCPEINRYILKKEIFDNEVDYYRQFK